MVQSLHRLHFGAKTMRIVQLLSVTAVIQSVVWNMGAKGTGRSGQVSALPFLTFCAADPEELVHIFLNQSFYFFVVGGRCL